MSGPHFSTLADALPLVKPSGNIHFQAHLVPIKKADEPLGHNPVGRFVTMSSEDQEQTDLIVDGHTKCSFSWNGLRAFDDAQLTVTLISNATMMINDQQLVLGTPVLLDDYDTIQILELDQPTLDITFYCVKFFYRKEHVLRSESQKTYEVLSFAGQGGYGTVHKCRNPNGEQRLAVKVAKIDIVPMAGSSSDGTQRDKTKPKESHEVTVLRRMWERVDQLKRELPNMKIDPHIVKLRDAWTVDDNQYLAMDMALGDLHQLVKQKGPAAPNCVLLTEPEVLSIARQLFEGLAFIHSTKHVHCDIKPSNILLYGRRLDIDDPYSRAVIGDFGVSQKQADLELAAAQGIPFTGTLGFIPPEVAFRPPVYSPAVDVWAAGITLFYAFTGVYIYHQVPAKQVIQTIIGYQDGHWKELSGLIGISPAGKFRIIHSPVAFLKRCLEVDYRDRITAEQALLDPWLRQAPQGGVFTPAMSNNVLPGPSYSMAIIPSPARPGGRVALTHASSVSAMSVDQPTYKTSAGLGARTAR
ncbi:kinase-like protein [Peniophora sp. CONT]|nr:kinase-like protein [Peniophora sp. CONT]